MDMQIVHLREVLNLTNFDLINMVRVVFAQVPVVSAYINDVETRFVSTGVGTLVVAIPKEATDNVFKVQLKTITDYMLDVPIREFPTEGELSAAITSAVLRISGERLSTTTAVYINKQPQPFINISDRELLCPLPRDIHALEDVTVLGDSVNIANNAVMDYRVGNPISSVSGPFKATTQFLKVLFTTPGSDVFHKKEGGGLQSWVGQTVPADSTHVAVAKAVLTVTTTAAKFIAAQAALRIPADEKVVSVDILSAAVDPVNPTSVKLKIKVNTASQKASAVDFLLGEVTKAVQSLTGT